MTEVDQYYQKISQSVRSIVKIADDLLRDEMSKDFKLPEWKEVTDKSKFYKIYGLEVQRKTTLVNCRSKMSKMSIQLRTLRETFSTSSLPPTILISYRRGVEELVKKLEDYKGILIEQIDKQNTVIRFLNSVQFMMGHSVYLE